VRGSPAWREKEDLLASMPGVGPITARSLIAELPELGALDAKRIASLTGLARFTRQSGQWKGRAMIAGGRKTVRSAFFLASLSACVTIPSSRPSANTSSTPASLKCSSQAQPPANSSPSSTASFTRIAMADESLDPR
jgi:transposase